MIPYGHQTIEEADIRAVVEVLRSDWLTTGPKIEEFEQAFARCVGVGHAVAVSSGTAALHASMYALGIAPRDEVIVSPMTFAASANCVIFQGGLPVFADVSPDTLLIDPEQVEKKITSRTKAIVAVDYAGHPCDYDILRALAGRHGLKLVADACHALGATYRNRPAGSLADMSVFSFHPVKHITTGEGGMVTTDNAALAQRMRRFRNHGITTDHRSRSDLGTWFYEMVDLGYNYRLSDLQCALGISQLGRLPSWVARRREIAARYDAAFGNMSALRPLGVRPDVSHAYHLYVVRVQHGSRDVVFRDLRRHGIGANVHYVPVHLHPFYRERFGTGQGLCPVAEQAYTQILSLPMYHGMQDDDVESVIRAVAQVLNG